MTGPSVPDDGLRRITARNSTLNVLDGVGWHIGIACLAITTILPAYVVRLGGGPLATGAVVAVWVFGTRSPQALSSWWCHHHVRTRGALLAIAVVQRLAALALVLCALAARAMDRSALVWFFLVYAAWSFSTGLAFPVWVEFVGRALHASVSGRAMGVRIAVSNLAGVAASLGAAALLGRLPFPANFAAVFALGFVALVLGFVPLALMREVPRSLEETSRGQATALADRPDSLAAYLRGCLSWALAPSRRRLVVGLSLTGLLWAPLGLFLPYGLSRFGAGLGAGERDALAGMYTFVQTLALAVVAWPAGRAADRLGGRWVVALGMAAGGLAPLLALVAWSPGSYALVYAAVGAMAASFGTGLIKLYMEESRGEERSRAIVALEGLTAPVLLVATLAGGAIAGRLGYAPVFLATAVIAVAGIVVLARGRSR